MMHVAWTTLIGNVHLAAGVELVDLTVFTFCAFSGVAGRQRAADDEAWFAVDHQSV